MRLSEIHLHPSASAFDSLTACLEAVLRAAGAVVDYRSVQAALGLPFWIAAPRDPGSNHCLGSWMAEGHDALLVEAGRLFGLRLRELHPPEAAVGLEDSPEFLQHFEASYRPLMEIALDHGQPVLVRRGWPDDGGSLWGLVTSRSASSLGFTGTAPERQVEHEPLTLPPVQVYVVEEIKPSPVTPEALRRHALEAARQVQHNQLDPRFGIVTGPAAYDVWLARLKEGRICPCGNHDGAKCHSHMAEVVCRFRESAIEIFAETRSTLHTNSVEIQALEEECNGVIDALACSRDVDAVSHLIRNPTGRAGLIADVLAAQKTEGALSRALDCLCQSGEAGRATEKFTTPIRANTEAPFREQRGPRGKDL